MSLILCTWDYTVHRKKKKRKKVAGAGGGGGGTLTKFPLETFLSVCYFYTNSDFILFFIFLHSSNIPLQIHKAISSFPFCRIKCARAESDEQEICINFPAIAPSQSLSFTGRAHKHAMNGLYVPGAFPLQQSFQSPHHRHRVYVLMNWPSN